MKYYILCTSIIQSELCKLRQLLWTEMINDWREQQCGMYALVKL